MKQTISEAMSTIHHAYAILDKQLKKNEVQQYIQGPRSVYELLNPALSLLDHEEFWVIFLNTRNRITGTIQLYKGCLNASTIRISEVFREAVRRNAASIIVAHNHPSGEVDISPEDLSVTRALIQAGKILDIQVLDHVIIGNRYNSLKESGIAF